MCYTIDAQCVYATGHSNGGLLTFLLAAQLSTRLAAVAPISGGSGAWRIMDNNLVRTNARVRNFLRKYRRPSPTSQSTNLALNKPVSSSALENSWLASSAVVDGNPNTRWASAHSDTHVLQTSITGRF